MLGLILSVLPICFLALSFCAREASAAVEQFEESLTIHPLLDGKLVTRFSFKTILKASPRNPETLGSDDASQHYTVFPLALGQILREYAITELHITLNAGNWNYDRWGSPDETGVGTGAELWAWMGDGAPDSSVDQRWRGLRNALGGLFCASLGSLDEQRTTSPVLAFAPEGSLPNWTLPHQLRHASLPSERVCTENLTPFLKLLPCKSLSGVASLLNPHRLFDADWHGMGIHVLWHPEEGVEVGLNFQAVFDPLRHSSINKRDWSFRSLFDRTITRSCPIAQSSRIFVDLPKQQSYILRPDPSHINESYAVFDVKDEIGALDIGVEWPDESSFDYRSTVLQPAEHRLSPLSIQRTLRGSTQDRGQLSVVITNNLRTPVRAIYLETMPWLVQFYLHTLKINSAGIRRDDLISNMSYTPPILHSRPTTLQSVLTIPPNDSIHLTIDVTKSFLRYTEHPPDAQRGWDLPPAVFVPLIMEGDSTSVHLPRMYTSVLLADLATPDFSMPYNVIILSCSLMAFIFGTIFNLLTRKFVIVRLDKDRR